MDESAFRRARWSAAFGWLLLLPVVVSMGLASTPANRAQVELVRTAIVSLPLLCFIVGLFSGRKATRLLAIIGLVVLVVLMWWR
jgi:hypothetical protein